MSTLNRRVNEHFKLENSGRHANREMILKTFIMYGIYFVPYGLAVGGLITGTWALLGVCVMMGIGLSGIGLSVMHDANHGAYARKKWLNRLIGLSLNLVGGNAFNWKVQHNVLHHTYTNIEGIDEDIAPRAIMRFSPGAAWKSYHRFQHYYAWFFYGLLTISWVIMKDFKQLIQFQREGYVKSQGSSPLKEWLIMILSKIVYIGYIVIVPLQTMSIAWTQLLVGLLVMHYVAGMILSLVFQPAHVIEGTAYPRPDENYTMETSWAVHQLNTTTNFAGRSRWFSWFVGGLNYQIEHHLFPHICHVHYRKLAKIVQETTMDFGLPYKSERTFVGAVWNHARLLKELGRKPGLA